jgi:phosphatidylglycerophosphate synthase
MTAFDEFKKKIQKPQINYTSPFYSRKIIKKISPYITMFLVSKTTISANQVTLLQLVFSLMGLTLICFENTLLAILGIVCLHIGYLFDVVDGEVARYHQTQSINGMFIDFVNHEMIMPFTYACLAFHVYFVSNFLPFFFIGLLLIVCGIGPVGKGRQTTVNYLILKRKSPVYNADNYAGINNEESTSSENVKIPASSFVLYLKSLRELSKSLFDYPNDLILIGLFLIYEALTQKMFLSQVFLAGIALFLSVDFCLTLHLHLKNRIPELTFDKFVQECVNIAHKQKQDEGQSEL